MPYELVPVSQLWPGHKKRQSKNMLSACEVPGYILTILTKTRTRDMSHLLPFSPIMSTLVWLTQQMHKTHVWTELVNSLRVNAQCLFCMITSRSPQSSPKPQPTFFNILTLIPNQNFHLLLVLPDYYLIQFLSAFNLESFPGYIFTSLPGSWPSVASRSFCLICYPR